MVRGIGEKTIKPKTLPPKKQGVMPSFVEGDRLSKTPKPKSLTPLGKSMKKK